MLEQKICWHILLLSGGIVSRSYRCLFHPLPARALNPGKIQRSLPPERPRSSIASREREESRPREEEADVVMAQLCSGQRVRRKKRAFSPSPICVKDGWERARQFPPTASSVPLSLQVNQGPVSLVSMPTALQVSRLSQLDTVMAPQMTESPAAASGAQTQSSYRPNDQSIIGTVPTVESTQQHLFTQLLNSFSRFTDSLNNPQFSVPVSSPANVWSTAANHTMPLNPIASVNTANVNNI